jgi:glycosyltransferase involved in cell wall biosynthesis
MIELGRSNCKQVKAPRILYVTSCWPNGNGYGGQLRAFHIGRALQQLGRPTLVVIGADEVEPKVKAKAAEEYDLGREIRVVPCPSRSQLSRAASIFDPAFVNIHGVVAEARDEAWMAEFQKQFDLTWFCKLSTANYFAKAKWHRSVVDVDDLPSTMERSFLKTSRDVCTQLKSRLRIFELSQHESRLHRRFDVLGVCSEHDREILGGRSSIHVIPNGFKRPLSLPIRKPSQPPRIGFMGLYSYSPNSEGVRWFIRHCWDRVKAEVPGVRLRLVGEDSNGPLKPNDPSVDGLGWVENPEEEVASWSHMIVPIRFGAGTRVKIADAFSRKCPVVSTRFGALGYEVEDGRELFLADNPADFAAACIRLLKDTEAATAMAERAYRRFLEKWTWEAISPRVLEAAGDCLRLNSGR